MQELKLGTCFHSKQEYRDEIHDALDVPLPTSFDADYSKVPVQMQNKIGICTAEAVCSLIERSRNDGIVLSRRFTYLVGKTLVDVNLDEGSSIKSMLQGAYKYGTQPESVVPTDTTILYSDFVNFDITPFISTATKIPGYINIPLYAIEEGIYKYNGIAVRFDCGATWYTSPIGYTSWQSKDILPLREPNPVISGHAVVFTGYDSYRTYLRNSWSTVWAMNGNGYAAYSPTEAWAISPSPIVQNLPNPQSWHHTFTQDLNYGMTNNSEVKNLQTALSILGYMDKKWITGNYWDITAQAVFQFQKDKCVSSVSDRIAVYLNFGKYCHAITRAALNAIFS